jgi:hypothetical protein
MVRTFPNTRETMLVKILRLLSIVVITPIWAIFFLVWLTAGIPADLSYDLALPIVAAMSLVAALPWVPVMKEPG